MRSFPDVDAGGQWQISAGGGLQPLWGPDGRELIYRGLNGSVMAVAVETDPSFRPGNPEPLFTENYVIGFGHTYDISPDGQRFLMLKESGQADGANARELVVILNWFTELQARVPTGR